MKRVHLVTLVLAATLPIAAIAQDARTTKWVNMRAGPAREYPLVERLEPNTLLVVRGCTQGFSWCDVIAPGNVHGWIYAANIDYPFQNAQVPVLTYGAAIGIPILLFGISSYWNEFYSDRPWFRDIPRWTGRPTYSRPNVRPPQPHVSPSELPRPRDIHPQRPVQPAPGQDPRWHTRPSPAANPHPADIPAHAQQLPKSDRLPGATHPIERHHQEDRPERPQGPARSQR